MTKPVLMRRGAIIREFGITKHVVTELVKTKQLTPIYLWENSRAQFARAQVESLLAARKQNLPKVMA